jgi:hypothetical protein
MKNPGRTAIALILLILSIPPPTGAGDDIREVSAMWEDFVAALRRGDYRAAHGLFSPESRAALPYPDFAREYGPLSAAREAVLARPESRSTRLEGDWAEIECQGTNPGSGRRFRIVASAVKNVDVWSLVAGRNEARERLEAAAREVIRTCSAWRGLPDAAQKLARLVETGTGGPVFTSYRFETDGRDFRAIPQGQGLRPFHLDAWGMVRPGTSSANIQPLAASPGGNDMPPSILAIPPIPPPPSAPATGLPELSEPPAGPAGLTGGLPELPPPAPAPRTVGIYDQEPLTLPDSIR